MNNVIVLYWQPGSGGDTVQQMLSQDPKFQTTVEKFDLNTVGRTTSLTLPWFIDNFVHSPGQWFWRSWSNSDLELLLQWPDRRMHTSLVLPTHSAEQARWIKKNLSGSVVVGITYQPSMYPCVLANWCRKVAVDDVLITAQYQSALHQTLAKKGHLGEVIFRDQLDFGTNILTSVDPEWDINLSFEQLLLGNINSLQELDLDLSVARPILHRWTQRQKKLYRYQWPVSDQLKQALGFNGSAVAQTHTDLPLDQFDKILVRAWCKANLIEVDNTALSTLLEADAWLKSRNSACL